MKDVIENLKSLVGEGGWVTDRETLAPHLVEWRDRVQGASPLLLNPSDTGQVAAIVRACAEAGVAIVPQGGNTGMCAGAVPDASGTQVIVNLARMNRVRSLDAAGYSLVAEAGCVLADLQEAARSAGRYLPLSLGGEGSCQIGGNVSTNAGGINVLRYGTARDLVLGLEVVLADGRIWDGLRTLRKNTAGYDLRQLFIGSEGTLGIVTAVALKLYPDPGETTTAMLAVDSAGTAVEILATLRQVLADRILAFELIGERAMRLVETHIPNGSLPFAAREPWYVLLDAALGAQADALASALEPFLDDGGLSDVIVASSHEQQARLWRLRHSISEAERREGLGIKHDISLPINAIEDFLQKGQQRLARAVPEAEIVVFGHVGDGNLHYNAHLEHDVPAAEAGRLAERVTEEVYGLVREMGGSISAEHGIGTLKRDALARYTDSVDLDLMRRLKVALDPGNTLNPGKVI